MSGIHLLYLAILAHLRKAHNRRVGVRPRIVKEMENN